MSFSIVFVVCITLFHSYTGASRLLMDDELGSETTDVPDAGVDPYASLTCNFDKSSFCGWKNLNPGFQWELGMGKDSWRRRGRTGVKNGKYIYINSDRGRNRTAFLASMDFNQTKNACLKFRYHMRGRHIGHLKIYDINTVPSKDIPGDNVNMARKLRWGVVGQQSDTWQNGQVQMPALDGSQLRQVIIEAFDREDGRAGNIVLDEIEYVKNFASCSILPSWAAPPVTQTVRPQTTLMTTASQTTEETTEQVTHTEIAKVPRLITRPVQNIYTTTNEIYNTTSQVTSSESATLALVYTQRFASTDNRTYEEPDKTTANATHELVTSQTRSEMSMQTTKDSYMTTKDEHISGINPVTRTDLVTLKTGGGVISGDSPAKLHIGIYIGAGLVGFALILILIVCCCRRIQQNRKFEYYDNHTVHMARIAGEDDKQPDGDTEYEKLS